MKVDTLLKRGSIHPEYCEDAIFHTKLSESWLVGAVFDGCSSAKDSYFASALAAKLVKKACKTLPYLSKIQPDLILEDLTPQYIGEFITSQVFHDMKAVNRKFLIDEIELLTTILIAVVNSKTKEAWINISGDGYFAIDNEIVEIDQNNMPDYLTYHLDLSFDKWLVNHTQSHVINKFERLSIATDGVNKLMTSDGLRPKNVDAVSEFLKRNTNRHITLDDKYKSLTSRNKLIPYDDIGIVHFS